MSRIYMVYIVYIYIWYFLTALAQAVRGFHFISHAHHLISLASRSLHSALSSLLCLLSTLLSPLREAVQLLATYYLCRHFASWQHVFLCSLDRLTALDVHSTETAKSGEGMGAWRGDSTMHIGVGLGQGLGLRQGNILSRNCIASV